MKFFTFFISRLEISMVEKALTTPIFQITSPEHEETERFSDFLTVTSYTSNTKSYYLNWGEKTLQMRKKKNYV